MIVVLVGGSGTLGRHVVPLLLQDPQVERIRILSRNEHVQAELCEVWAGERIDFFVGDVRDPDRVMSAIAGAHQVYHFAASKRVESCEYNPQEAIKTNVDGTRNVIRACVLTPTVEKAVYTSTDKAVEPLNVYGITKALAEKLWITGNIGKHRCRMAACRYGNVWGSHGSVVERWRKQVAQGKRITVVNGGMTRFFIGPTDAASFVVSTMRGMDGGEVFIPKMKATKMTRLADAFAPRSQQEFISPRPGEKLHEKLVADAEVGLVTEVGDRMVRWPEYGLFPVKKHGDTVSEVYSSATAPQFTDEELKGLVSA